MVNTLQIVLYILTIIKDMMYKMLWKYLEVLFAIAMKNVN